MNKWILTLVVSMAMTVRSAVLIYDGFDYSGATLGNANGGTGFSGGWALGPNSGGTLQGSSTATLGTSSLSSPSDYSVNKTGVSLSDVGGGAARTFGTNIDLGSDTTRYFSYLWNESGTGSGGILQVSFLTSTTYGRKAFDLTTISGQMYLRVNNTLTSVGSTAFTAGNDYLLVGKIEATAAGADTISFSIFQNGTSIGSEPVTWDVSGNVDAADYGVELNRLRIEGSGNVDKFDEFIIGESFTDVVQAPVVPVSVVERFNYATGSLGSKAATGSGLTGNWKEKPNNADPATITVTHHNWLFDGIENYDVKPSTTGVGGASGTFGAVALENELSFDRDSTNYYSLLIYRTDTDGNGLVSLCNSADSHFQDKARLAQLVGGGITNTAQTQIYLGTTNVENEHRDPGTSLLIGRLITSASGPDSIEAFEVADGGFIDATSFDANSNIFSTNAMITGTADTLSLWNFDGDGSLFGEIRIGSTYQEVLSDDSIHGVPTNWVLTYWASTNDYLAVENDDSDGDGLSNRDEYFADTIPVGAGASDSTLKILTVTNIAPPRVGNFIHYKNGGTNADVFIQYSNSVSQAFVNLYTNPAPSSITNLYLHQGVTNATVYRLRGVRND